MKDNYLGNVYGKHDGFDGSVFDPSGIAKTVVASVGGVSDIVEVKTIGHLEKGTGAHQSNMVYDAGIRFLGSTYGLGTGYAGCVFDKDGISPGLGTMQGGGRQPSVVIEDVVHVRQATKDGLIPCEIGGVADLNYPESKTRRGRVIEQGQISPTLTTESIPSVLERWTWEVDGVKYIIRIRKLTPKECWRLMGCTDEDFEKAAAVNSNTQLYKQAGNSIVVDVLEGIFKNLIGEENERV